MAVDSSVHSFFFLLFSPLCFPWCAFCLLFLGQGRAGLRTGNPVRVTNKQKKALTPATQTLATHVISPVADPRLAWQTWDQENQFFRQ